MFERIRLNPDYPQNRFIRHAVDVLHKGLPVVLPTGTTYALVCLPRATEGQEIIRAIRRFDENHLWSLICRDLSQASSYAKIDNLSFRVLRRLLPGPYTCILPASAQLPRRVFGKRRDVGIRMPDHPISQMVLDELDEPLLATTLQFPGESEPACDPDIFSNQLAGQQLVILDVGWGTPTPTTVLDLCQGEPVILRQGAGIWPVNLGC